MNYLLIGDHNGKMTLRLIERGVDPSLIFVWDNSTKGEHCVRIEGATVTSNLDDYDHMKFDVVIGNPPYQESGHKAKTSSLWKKFLEYADTHCNGKVCLIIPASFCSPTKLFSHYKSRLSKLDLTVKKYFRGVGSSFCSVTIERDIQSTCEVITDDGVFHLNMNEWDCVPKTLNGKIVKLIDDNFGDSDRFWRVGYEYDQRKSIIKESGSIPILHSTKTLFTDTDHPNNHTIRVFCTITNGTRFNVVTSGTGLSQNNIWTMCATIEEAEQLKDHLNSPDIQTLLKAFQFSNMNYVQIINKLSCHW